MANRLKMAEHQAIIRLARLSWSYRRIAAELGVDRETVSRHVKAAAARGDPVAGARSGDPNATIVMTASMGSEVEANATIPMIGSAASAPDPNAAIPITGSTGRRSLCEPWREVIVASLERGLTA